MSDPDYQEVLAPNVYFDHHFECEVAKILPGEYHATARDMAVVTVLGSCVGACLRDPESGVGGMNHFMLPVGDDRLDPVSPSARYGTYAMEILINHLMKLGAQRSRLEAKVFGGGNILRGFRVTHMGEDNAEFLMGFMQREGIRVVAHDLLDLYPRKVYYFPRTGKVLIRRLRTVHNDTIVNREKEYEGRLQYAPIEGEIELFE